MPALEEATSSLRSRTPIAELIRALQSRRAVDVDHRDDYLMVRARATGAIAIYAHDDRIAICLAPERAYALEGQQPFRRQVPRTPVTSYVIVTAEEMREHLVDVIDLAVEAVDWRSVERTNAFCARCGVGCPAKLDACPNCWTEVNDRGGCLCHGALAVVRAS